MPSRERSRSPRLHEPRLALVLCASEASARDALAEGLVKKAMWHLGMAPDDLELWFIGPELEQGPGSCNGTLREPLREGCGALRKRYSVVYFERCPVSSGAPVLWDTTISSLLGYLVPDHYLLFDGVTHEVSVRYARLQIWSERGPTRILTLHEWLLDVGYRPMALMKARDRNGQLHNVTVARPKTLFGEPPRSR